jgi:hypothetical protein
MRKAFLITLTIEQTAAMFGVTVEAVKAQYAANADVLERMYNKAVSTGKKQGGLTAEQLKGKVEQYKALAQ